MNDLDSFTNVECWCGAIYPEPHATDCPYVPTTATGRALLARGEDDISMYEHEWRATILAIEAEARAEERARIVHQLLEDRRQLGLIEEAPNPATLAERVQQYVRNQWLDAAIQVVYDIRETR